MKGTPITLYVDDYVQERTLCCKYLTLTEIKELINTSMSTCAPDKMFRVCPYRYEKWMGVDYTINFMENGSYTISMQDQLLSRGEWKAVKKTVYLCDEILNTTFYLFQEGNTLVGKALPGYYDMDIVLNPVLSSVKTKKKPIWTRLFHRT